MDGGGGEKAWGKGWGIREVDTAQLVTFAVKFAVHNLLVMTT